MGVAKISYQDIFNYSESISKIGENMEKKSVIKNKQIKSLMEESKKDLVDMMNESYQDAFNIETRKKKK